MNFNIKKGLKKSCRSISKSSFLPNGARIYFLRNTGVNIGDGVVINEGFTLACDIGYESNLIIEDRVAFGPNVTVIVTSHPNNSKLREFNNTYSFIEDFGQILIRHDAWIGAGATILSNITIGEYSVIGAGAVVTKNVLPYTVVAGVPAKVIRSISFGR